MSKYQFGSIVDRDFRNTLQRVADEVEVHGKTIQELVVEGQLAPEQLSELLNAVNSGSPRGAFNTLEDLESAYPNGAEGVYVVTEDGHWYYYGDGVWHSGGVYQSTQWQNALTKQNETWVV